MRKGGRIQRNPQKKEMGIRKEFVRQSHHGGAVKTSLNGKRCRGARGERIRTRGRKAGGWKRGPLPFSQTTQGRRGLSPRKIEDWMLPATGTGSSVNLTGGKKKRMEAGRKGRFALYTLEEIGFHFCYLWGKKRLPFAIRSGEEKKGVLEGKEGTGYVSG